MRKILTGLVVVWITVGGCGISVDKKPVVKKWIQQLGSVDQQTRQSAQKELMELGKKLIGQYRQLKSKVKAQHLDSMVRGESSQPHLRRESGTPDFELQALYDELRTLASDLQEASQDNNTEVKMRVEQIRQYLYDLTTPKMAFVSDRDGDKEIYVMNLSADLPGDKGGGVGIDGKDPKRLTENETFDCGPAWSPDGAKIAFVSYRDGDPDIYVMDADGKNQRRLVEEVSYYGQAAWSPDGTKIIFTSDQDGNDEIYVIDLSADEAGADGKNQTRLTENEVRDSNPTWSPDGAKIAFQSNRDGNFELYVMEVSGKNLKRLTENLASDYYPVWSPDGTKIVFVSDRDINHNIYIMDADGKNQRRLTEVVVYNILPAWDPAGTKIAFTSWRDGNEEIYVMDADGRNQKRLTEHPANDRWPTWCPLSIEEISRLFASMRE